LHWLLWQCLPSESRRIFFSASASCLTVACGSVASSQSIVAKKEFISERNGLYTIRVAYKKGSSGVATDVKIKDALPEYLELVSGELAVSGPNVSLPWLCFFVFFLLMASRAAREGVL
jgi:hypothetical protein